MQQHTHVEDHETWQGDVLGPPPGTFSLLSQPSSSSLEKRPCGGLRPHRASSQQPAEESRGDEAAFPFSPHAREGEALNGG